MPFFYQVAGSQGKGVPGYRLTYKDQQESDTGTNQCREENPAIAHDGCHQRVLCYECLVRFGYLSVVA